MTVLSDAARAFNLDPEPDLDRRLEELCRESYPDELPPEIGEEYVPSQEDYEWMRAADLDSFLPRDLPLADWVAEKARQMMLLDDARHEWLGQAIDRMAQLVHWTGATTPAEHDERLEVYDRELRERSYQDGYADGVVAARR